MQDVEVVKEREGTEGFGCQTDQGGSALPPDRL